MQQSPKSMSDSVCFGGGDLKDVFEQHGFSSDVLSDLEVELREVGVLFSMIFFFGGVTTGCFWDHVGSAMQECLLICVRV
jgi:hypothetical protein